jgi:outer membrane protein
MKKSIVNKSILIFSLFIGMSTFSQSKKWTLEECVAYALKNNISIKQSDLDNRTAAIEKKTAIGAFLPTINANGTHSWNIGLNQNVTTGILENQTTQNTSLGLNSGITIYNGLENQNRLRRANLSIVAAQYQLSKMKDDVALNIANAFLQILFNKENLKVQGEQLSNNERQLTRSQALVDAGSVPRGDLLDIKATVATNKQNVILAENALFISKLSLAQLLQLSDFQNFDVAEQNYESTDKGIMIQNPETILKKAKEERVELKIAATNLALAEKDVLIAKGAFQPKLSGFYSFSTRAGYSDRVVGVQSNSANPFSANGTFVNVGGTNYPVFQPNFTPVLGKAAPVFDQFSDYKGHSFGLQLSIPILNGFSARNNVERYKIALDRSKIAQQQTELDLERNVYTAYTNAKGAINAFESAKVSLEARQEAFNYAKEKYAVGLMNSFDFNQSQTLLVNAQSEVLRTKYDYIFKVKIVELYFGIPIIKKQ